MGHPIIRRGTSPLVLSTHFVLCPNSCTTSCATRAEAPRGIDRSGANEPSSRRAFSFALGPRRSRAQVDVLGAVRAIRGSQGRAGRQVPRNLGVAACVCSVARCSGRPTPRRSRVAGVTRQRGKSGAGVRETWEAVVLLCMRVRDRGPAGPGRPDRCSACGARGWRGEPTTEPQSRRDAPFSAVPFIQLGRSGPRNG